MKVIHRWRTLPPEERRSVRETLFALPLVRVLLRSFGYRRSHRWLASRPRPAEPADTDRLVRSYVLAADRVGRRIPGGANCLDRSLCLWWLLRRRGVDSDLRFGVRKTDEGDLEGHAWIERLGAPINDDPTVHERFSPFEEAIFPRIRP